MEFGWLGKMKTIFKGSEPFYGQMMDLSFERKCLS